MPGGTVVRLISSKRERRVGILLGWKTNWKQEFMRSLFEPMDGILTSLFHHPCDIPTKYASHRPWIKNKNTRGSSFFRTHWTKVFCVTLVSECLLWLYILIQNTWSMIETGLTCTMHYEATCTLHSEAMVYKQTNNQKLTPQTYSENLWKFVGLFTIMEIFQR